MEALAQLLADRLKTALPFFDRAVGLARLYTKTIADGDGTRVVKYPVPVSFTAAECETDERYLLPDPNTQGIIFFEDGGTQPVISKEFPLSLGIRQTSLRLLLWANAPVLAAGVADEFALLLKLEKALNIGRRYSVGDFLDLYTTYTTLPAETSLFSRYTYATETPLLLPPYRILGLDLKVQYRVRYCVPPVVTRLHSPAFAIQFN